MSFLYDNLAAIVVAACMSAVAWCYGGLMGPKLEPLVPWLFVLMMEVMIFFPQRHGWESLYDARSRAWNSMKRDPLVWVALGFFLILLIPLVNNGLCPSCDAAKIANGIDPAPPIPILPFCVDRTDHYHVILWFAIVLPAMVIARHCLVSAGRRIVMGMLVWNGVALAILGFVQNAVGACGPLWTKICGYDGKSSYFFSTFGYPNVGGDYFCTLFAIAIAMWRDHYERVRTDFEMKDISKSAPKQPRMFWKKHFYLIPAMILYFATINTLSRASMIAVTVLAFICFVHTLMIFLNRMQRAKRVIVGTWSMIAFSLIIYFSINCMPNDVRHEMKSLDSGEVLDRMTGKGDYHPRISFELWKQHKLFGCGGWGYAHLSVPTMQPEERRRVQLSGGVNVHNDYMQFLAEHGAIGLGALVAMAVMLIWPIAAQWRKMARAINFTQSKHKPPKPMSIFILPAPVFIILLSALMTCIHAFGDCPMRSPAVLSLFYVSLAALPGFMPRNENKK